MFPSRGHIADHQSPPPCVGVSYHYGSAAFTSNHRHPLPVGQHIYFEGTDPRHPGVPPQGPRGWVKTPREQFEDGLTVQEWYAYTGLE